MTELDLSSGGAIARPKLAYYLLKAIAGGLFVYAAIFAVSFTADFFFGTKSVVILTLTRCALLALCATYLFVVVRFVPKLLDVFSLTIFAVLAVGAVVGLMGDGDWFTYFRQGFQYCFLLALYLVGRSLGREQIPQRRLTQFCIAILISYTLAIVLYALHPGLQDGSYSYQPNLALLPLSHGFVSGQTFSSIWAVAIIVIGNKRAVFLSACFIAAVLVAGLAARRYLDRGTIVRLALIGALFPLFTIAANLAVSGLSRAGVPLLTVADRFTTQSTYDAQTPEAAAEDSTISAPGRNSTQDAAARAIQTHPEQLARQKKEHAVDPLLRLTGARNVEVLATWTMLQEAPFGEIVGVGLGTQFNMRYISPAYDEPVQYWRDQADLFPAHLALTSGIPLAIAACLAFLWAHVQLVLRAPRLDATDLTVVLFVLGCGFDTMLGFNATNPIVWGAMGYATMRIGVEEVA